ncbi:hypothetical protein VSDG_03468 [Cytospora chrysosperma]|uniref:Zn(2)-C6 fungal-type domain-containing protein n=1 Tax=Cytospora chrysosperma TaxID=252740 RepID=A0A423W9T9_CYTCH|nr:hypothetical protein VSDG_03468 [Valsa sordida]
MLAHPSSDPMAQPQRQSCDRCYKQKLRCTRENVGEDKVCDRCSRKGVPCVYSSSLPKGRPSLQRQAEESAANEAAGLRRSSESELREAQAQTASSPTEVMHPASSGASIVTDMAVESLLSDPTTGESENCLWDANASTEAWSWLDQLATNDGQMCADWGKQGDEDFDTAAMSLGHVAAGSLVPGVSQYNPASSSGLPSSPVIAQLFQLGMRLSSLHDSCSSLANPTQPFSEPLPHARRARLVQSVAFDSVAVWLAQGHSSVDNADWSPPVQDHASSERRTQVPTGIQGQDILREVFSASHDFLEIFRHLNADRAREQLDLSSAAPRTQGLDPHIVGNWDHNGAVIPNVSMHSGSSEGQPYDTKVVKHLVTACDMMLLQIHLAVLTALRYDARLNSQPTGPILGDARVILVVQLCSLLIERQCQAVDLYNIEGGD